MPGHVMPGQQPPHGGVGQPMPLPGQQGMPQPGTETIDVINISNHILVESEFIAKLITEVVLVICLIDANSLLSSSSL